MLMSDLRTCSEDQKINIDGVGNEKNKEDLNFINFYHATYRCILTCLLLGR